MLTVSCPPPQSLLRAIEVLKRGVFRLRQEKETLEADVREQVVSETMEVFTSMQNDFRWGGAAVGGPGEGHYQSVALR